MKSLNEQAATSCPDFLKLLEEDPNRAFWPFYRYSWALLTDWSRRAFRFVPVDEREDVISETIFHCWSNDQRVLRKYKDQKRSFAAWLIKTARRQAQHHVRSVEVRERNIVHDPEDTILDAVPSAAPSELDRLESREDLGLAEAYVGRLGPRCQVLVRFAAKGYGPAELASFLREPPEAAKRIWNQLRDCRARLTRLMEADGIDPNALKGAAGGRGRADQV